MTSFMLWKMWNVIQNILGFTTIYVHVKSLPKLGRSRTGGNRLNCPWIPRDRKRPWPEDDYKCRHCIAMHRNNTSLYTLQKVDKKAKAKMGAQLSISGSVCTNRWYKLGKMREFGVEMLQCMPDSEDSYPCVHNSLIRSLHKPVAGVLDDP